MLSGLPSINPYINKFAITLIAVLASIIFAALIWVPYSPKTYNFKINEIANETIASPRNITIQTTEDKKKTLELKEERKKSVLPVKVIDEKILKDVLSLQTTFFTQIKRNIPTTADITLSLLSPDQMTFLNETSDQSLTAIEYYTKQNTQSIMQKGLETINPKEIKTRLDKNLNILQLSPLTQNIIFTIITSTIKPNKTINLTATDLAIEKELKNISPIETSYKRSSDRISKRNNNSSSYRVIKSTQSIWKKAKYPNWNRVTDSMFSWRIYY